MSVLIADEGVKFTLDERHRQVVLRPEDRNTAYGPLQELRPTGELVLRIDEYLNRGTRVSWRDTQTKPLEEQLNRIIIGLLTAAAVLRERRVRREEEARREKAAREERMRQEEARRAEEARLTDLTQRVGAWQHAANIRAYVKAVQATARRFGADLSSLESWASWALAQADRMDPLISGNPFPIDHKPEELPAWSAFTAPGQTRDQDEQLDNS